MLTDGGGKNVLLPKICPTYPTMMKLGTVIPYFKENLKHIKITWHTRRLLLKSVFFSPEIRNFVISRNTYIPTPHLLVQSQQCKRQNNALNLFKVNNIDPRTMSLTSFWCLYYSLWTYFKHCFGVWFVNVEQDNASWVDCNFNT